VSDAWITVAGTLSGTALGGLSGYFVGWTERRDRKERELLAERKARRLHPHSAATLGRSNSSQEDLQDHPGGRISWVVAMGFDGDDDWALSDDGWNLILAGGNQVIDGLPMTSRRCGQAAGLQGHLMCSTPCLPFTSAGTTVRSQRPSWRRPGPWWRGCVGRMRRVALPVGKDCSARLPTTSP
jgi:hypothetical protein